MHIYTGKYWLEVKDSYGIFMGRINATEGYGNPIGRITVSTDLDPWEIPETESLTKVHT